MLTATDTAQNVTSPNYPGNYEAGLDCSWMIRSLDGSRVQLTLLDMDIEGSTNCPFDKMTVLDGKWLDLPNLEVITPVLVYSDTPPQLKTTQQFSGFATILSGNSKWIMTWYLQHESKFISMAAYRNPSPCRAGRYNNTTPIWFSNFHQYFWGFWNQHLCSLFTEYHIFKCLLSLTQWLFQEW